MSTPSESRGIRPIAFIFLMPAAANIQLPRALGQYDSNGFDDIFEMIFHPPPPPPPPLSTFFSSLFAVQPPSCLRWFRIFSSFFFAGCLGSVQSLPTEFHIDAEDGERPSSSYIIIEQNIMLADERPAAKMYYHRQHRCNTDGGERRVPSPSSSARSTNYPLSPSPLLARSLPLSLFGEPEAAMRPSVRQLRRDYILRKYNVRLIVRKIYSAAIDTDTFA